MIVRKNIFILYKFNKMLKNFARQILGHMNCLDLIYKTRSENQKKKKKKKKE